MAKIIDLPTFKDDRGDLTVIEKLLDYSIKRVYYIYNCDDSVRGGHSHKTSRQTLISIHGSCRINVHNEDGWRYIALDSQRKALSLDADDFHTMDNFSDDCVLLVLASEYFDQDDYIDEDIWEND